MTVRVLVTGGAGFLGSRVVTRLAATEEVEEVVSVDVRPGPQGPRIRSELLDVRDPALADLVREWRIDRIVHLAAVVTPRPDQTREELRSIDVGGTANVVAAALAAGVGHLTVTSSGAAYGYHDDNPEWIDEDHPLRGNPEFAYADHKRQVEELLAKTRGEHPELTQLVLRPGTILGAGLRNQITALFEAPVIVGIVGSDSPFVFIWETDAVEVIVRGTLHRRGGVFNLAGDGAVPLRRIADEMGTRFVALPAPVVKAALAVGRRLGISPYGPEQVVFLRHRPVLSNRRLVEEFGYRPKMTSLQAFRAWRDSRA